MVITNEEGPRAKDNLSRGDHPRGAKLLRRPTLWLLLVTAVYVGAQPLLFHMHRPLDYDESVYVSQVYHGAVVLPFGAQRARGISWLVYPAAAFGPPVVVIRYYMLLVSGVLFFVAFRAWVPVLRMRAVAAAAVYMAGWTTLYFGTVVYPDLATAFGCIAAGGYLAQHLAGGTDHRSRNFALVKAAVAIGLAAVVRPPEATFFTIGALVVAATVKWRLIVTRYVVLGLGLAAGWLPWVIEAYLRFGGPVQRLQVASGVQGHPGYHPATTAWQYLTITGGPLGYPSPNARPPLIGDLWWLVLAAGIVLALWRAVRRRDRAAAVAVSTGFAMAAQYLLVLTGTAINARYLVPAYGLLTVCLAAALPLPARRWARIPAWTVIAASYVVFAVWNIGVAQRLESQQNQALQMLVGEARILRALDGRGPCFFASDYEYPEISFASGCTGTSFDLSSTTLDLPASATGPVYVFTSQDPTHLPIRPVEGTVRRVRVPGTRHYTWLFRAPSSAWRATG